MFFFFNGQVLNVFKKLHPLSLIMPVSPELSREIGVSGAPLLVQIGSSCKGLFLYPVWAAWLESPFTHRLKCGPVGVRSMWRRQRNRIEETERPGAQALASGALSKSLSGLSKWGLIVLRELWASPSLYSLGGGLAKLYPLYQILYP